MLMTLGKYIGIKYIFYYNFSFNDFCVNFMFNFLTIYCGSETQDIPQ